MSIAQIYHPSIDEIRPLIAKATEKASHLHSRIEKAEAILLNGDVIWRDDHWQVWSQSDDRTRYNVGPHGCNCPDFIHGNDNLFLGRPACKHRLAYLMYREILIGHMIRMIDGPDTGANIRRMKQQPICLYCQDRPRVIGDSYNGVSLSIATSWSGSRKRRQFATARDMAEFAEWLAQVAQVEPGAVGRETVNGVNGWPTAGTNHVPAVERDLTMFADRPDLQYEDGIAYA